MPSRSAPALRLSCSSPRHPHLAFPHCHINASQMHLSVPEAAQEFPEVQEQEQGEGQSWDRELERVRERAKSPAVTACLPDRKDQRNSSLFLKASPGPARAIWAKVSRGRHTAGVATSMAFLGSSLNEMESRPCQDCLAILAAS